REYATGRGRTDLLVSWPLGDGEQRRIVIECKVRRARNSINWVIAQGIEQIGGYMNRCGTAEGHLVVFESDASKTWDERIFRYEEAVNGSMVVVWGC
ncbi:MAG: ATP-binding protein, partial [Gammaproteobacteria bacterium]|nr:ATP-binding protein [Gammaproteobacteria bacterium]